MPHLWTALPPTATYPDLTKHYYPAEQDVGADAVLAAVVLVSVVVVTGSTGR